MKRCLDAIISVGVLFVCFPLLVALWCLVRFSMGRPVLFRQLRAGLQGKGFLMFKFRTMTPGDGEDASRITRVGRFLRTTSLDELPELWNVLRGDMSLVGPRPLLMEYLPLYSPEQARRHEVRPGITGWAQVNGRNALTWEEKFALDLWYVEHRSLWLDLRILLRTVGMVFLRRGISAAGEVTMPKFKGTVPRDGQVQG